MMHGKLDTFRPSALSVIGGFAMTAGALIYMHDQLPKVRNWHLFLWPALILMALGAIMAAAGALMRDAD
jgi:hypothetical protein